MNECAVLFFIFLGLFSFGVWLAELLLQRRKYREKYFAALAMLKVYTKEYDWMKSHDKR